MKKITLLSFAVLFSTMMFANSNSNDASQADVKKKNESTFNLTYKAEKASNVTISIVNGDGQIIFSETLKNTDGFMRPYDFSEMGKGIYTIEITDAYGEHTSLIDFRTIESEKQINVKKIAGDESRYLLTASGNGLEAITVNIYDAFDTLIHTDTAITNGNYGQVYNLGKRVDAVKFEITNQDRVVKTVKY